MSPESFCNEYYPCDEGRTFALQYKTMREVWENCKRPDWLFWILNRLSHRIDPRILRLFAVWCSRNTPLADGRTTWDLVKDARSRKAVEVAERYANGNATIEELSAAQHAAWAAATSAARAAESAAWAASWTVAGAAASAAASAARAATIAATRAAMGAMGAVAAKTARTAEVTAWAAQANKLKEMIPNPF